MQTLIRKWAAADRVLVFTGAGMSTASGIPDFRGPDGLWEKWRPVYFQDFLASEDARIRHWNFKLAGWDGFRLAEPNAAHRALARLRGEDLIACLVTQNIDGLHQLGGYPPEEVLELHGTNRLIECVVCNELVEPDAVFEEFRRTGKPPRCPCGGFQKPATISFGQSMPHRKLSTAMKAARECDLVLSLGSSLTVEPAASVPIAGKRSGAFYAIVNRGRTAHDGDADLVLDGDVTDIVPAIADALCRH